MRHISIGSIKEIRNGDNLIFKVSLLNGEIVSLFDNRSAALEYMKVHVEGLINTRKIDAVCVEYINVRKQKHYLMIDTLMNGPDDRFKNPSIHEQTLWEYRTSHPLYYRKHATRRIVNERSYTFSDILRAAVNWKPQFSILVGLSIIALAIISAIFAISTLGFISHVTDSTKSAAIVNDITIDKTYMGLIFGIIWVVGITTFATILVSYKRYLKHIQTQDDIDWHKWYKQRITLFTISNVFIIAAIVLFVLFYKDLMDQNFFNENKFPLVTSTDKHWVVGTSLALIILLSCLFLGQFSMFVVAEVVRHVKLKQLYTNKEERIAFYKWLHSKNKHPELQRSQLDIFLFDPELSKWAAHEEITASREIMAASTWEEVRHQRNKAKSNYKRAKTAYLDRIKRAENYKA